jgi:hypothetical protein
MSADQLSGRVPKAGYRDTVRSLSDDWKRLADRYLPLASENSIWRYSRPHSPEDQEQGWKLHIAATVLSANTILERVAPLLSDERYLFKAAASLQELARLNAGLYYGFSQVGKFITVYPKSSEDAVHLAARLHEVTRGLPAPAVPYDRPYGEGSPIYYRYGAFGSLEIENPDGTRTSAIRNDKNEIVPDRREPGAAVPEWETDPFRESVQSGAYRLEPTIKPFEALSQRGKGGVYRALDLSVTPARLCILKEGRHHGETDWEGRDGYWRVEHEERVLKCLRGAGLDVPQVHRSFRTPDHYYLVMEFVEGQSLQSLLAGRRRKMPIAQALEFGARLGEIVHRIHSVGWVWRDCKPMNVVAASDGQLRPLDFEGACRVEEPDTMPWGTPGYISPEADKDAGRGSRVAEDLYALGATLHHILSGRIPDGKPPQPIGKVRRRVPSAIREVIAALLDPEPNSRPDAARVSEILQTAEVSSR